MSLLVSWAWMSVPSGCENSDKWDTHLISSFNIGARVPWCQGSPQPPCHLQWEPDSYFAKFGNLASEEWWRIQKPKVCKWIGNQTLFCFDTKKKMFFYLDLNLFSFCQICTYIMAELHIALFLSSLCFRAIRTKFRALHGSRKKGHSIFFSTCC